MDLPVLTPKQLEVLEALFPPKCFNPSTETAEQHQAYRGKVELIIAFRRIYDENVSHEAEIEARLKSEGANVLSAEAA